MSDDKKTHAPNRNGTLCGMFPPPTDARDYDPNDPTCETCSRRLKDAQKNSARIMANAAIAARAAEDAKSKKAPKE